MGREEGWCPAHSGRTGLRNRDSDSTQHERSQGEAKRAGQGLCGVRAAGRVPCRRGDRTHTSLGTRAGSLTEWQVALLQHLFQLGVQQLNLARLSRQKKEGVGTVGSNCDGCGVCAGRGREVTG